MKVLLRNERIAQIWAEMVEKALEKRAFPCSACDSENCCDCWDNFPINASSPDEGHGVFGSDYYLTGSGYGEYIFTKEGMFFCGRRNSFLGGSDCVSCSHDGVTLSIDDSVTEISCQDDDWQLVETSTPERGLFDLGQTSFTIPTRKVVGRKVKVRRLAKTPPPVTF